MAWDLDKQTELARDEQFAEQVRALARDLIAADPHLAEHLTPLCFYGSNVAGTLVRFGPHLRVDVRRLPDGDLCARLVYVQQALTTAEADTR